MMDETLKKLKPFWSKEGWDYVANLGIMQRAIVVRKFASDLSGKNSYYAIGQASYFPFTHEQYSARFDDPYDACMLAEKHIQDWFNSLVIAENKTIESQNKLSEGIKEISD